ncbi:MAG: hypothetical protein IJ890_04035 [Clostridia bacterium]|nr:hypothetical protein [Clostridia bacterium]
METTLNNKYTNIHSKLIKLLPYIFCYFIFSFLGWILETIFCFCVLGEFTKRGFLYGPICPIYRHWSIIFSNLFRPFKKQ